MKKKKEPFSVVWQRHKSKYLMILTLFMIGANLSREKLRELGIKPLIHGVLLWLVLSVVWCLAIHFKLIGIQ